MGTFSPWHFIILASVLVVPLTVIPIWRILQRLGLNPIWSLLYFVPFGGLIGLWILAWKPWPSPPTPANQASVF